MQLLKCHIENFGKLSDFSMDFRENYNVICSDNGSGKSTLAAFIRVMFYGFEGERKRKGLNERNFYNPWQGGVYGGQLTFTTKGKIYTVSRVFGSKESEDRFELRNAETNSLSIDFSQNIGRELFEIDSESFMRTVFISGSDIDTQTTGDINAKMGNLTDNTEDLTDYDTAARTIKDLLHQMDPNRKRGSIKQLKDRITQLEAETHREGNIYDNMERLREKIRNEKNEIDHLANMKIEIDKNRKMLEKFRDVSVLIDKYTEMEERYKEAEQQVRQARVTMNGVLSSKEELDVVQKKAVEMAEAKSVAVSSKPNNEEIERFIHLQQKFTNRRNPLSKEEFVKVRDKIDLLQSLREKQKAVELPLEDRKLLGQYKKLYGTSERMEEHIEKMEELYEKYNIRKSNIVMIKEQLEERKNRIKSGNGKFGIINFFAVIGLLLIAFGLYMFKFDAVIGLLIIICAVAEEFVVSLCRKKFKSTRDRMFDKIHRIEEGIKNDKADLYEMESVLLRFSGADKMDPKVIKEAFRDMRMASAKFRSLEARKVRELQTGGDPECMMIATEIAQFLNRWGVLQDEKNFNKSVNFLEDEWMEFNVLRNAVAEFEFKKKIYFNKKKEIENYLVGLGIKPSLDLQGQIIELRDLFTNFLHKQENAAREAERLKDFDREYNVNSLKKLLNSHWKEDLDDIDNQYEENRKATLIAQKKIDDLEREVEILKGEKDDIRNAGDELLVLYRKKDEESKKYRMLKYTGEILAKAKETLTGRYSQPLKESFDRYFKLLSGLDGDDYHIDSSGVLTVKEQGLQREVSSFSSGYKDMMGLCMRLAFVDVMYPQEKPPILLDDPFINLDKEKVEKGKQLLEIISETYQVIYLTCNEDRK